MTGMTSPSAFEYSRSEQAAHDVSWYGTLGFLAGCIVLLAAAFFVG